MSEPIDIEAKVTRLEVAGSAELERARELVAKVLAERERWGAAWGALLVDASKAVIDPFPPETVGCEPGSCQLKVGERVVAKFVVRYREDLADVEIDADWPRE